MLKRLQRKFIGIAMGSLFVILLVLLGVLNGAKFYQMQQKTGNLLSILMENEGRFPEVKGGRPPREGDRMGHLQLSQETPFETRYFTARVNHSGDISQIDTGHIAAVDSSQAQQYAQAVLDLGDTGGYLGQYRYQVQQKDYGRLIVFLDCRSELQSTVSLLVLSSTVSLGILAVMFLLVRIFSCRAIRPVIESMEKQKRFITDASHEIKTPLAVISANTEVLELTQGENEWTASTKNQISRLNGLVGDMLTLSRMEEEQARLVFTEFSLSDAVQEAAQPFEAVARSLEKQLEICVQPRLTGKGDESSIRQLVGILLDNAVKYSSGAGTVRVELSRQGKYARLQVSNPCQQIPQNPQALFDRFYRADSSRTRNTGGYGIGLSVAQAIVQAHKGKISAWGQDGIMYFQAQLPLVNLRGAPPCSETA